MGSRSSIVQVVAHGPASAAARLWRYRDKLRVTVVVKATFTLVQQGLMRLAPPEPIVTDDVHHGNNPVRSVRLTSDLAPYLPRAEVLFTGHAYAHRSEPVASAIVGISLFDGYDRIFDKYLEVKGDVGPEGVVPFQKMPLRYERAFGGPGWEDNPFGTGAGGTKGQPNVFYINEQRRSAGFAPFSAHWPARKKLVSAETRKALTGPIAEIPEGFDWTYFHASPPDQRCPFLGGSEWLVLEGLHPEERRMRSRLPAAKGLALVYWAGEDPQGSEPLELLADTLRIDGDKGTCSVAWRKSFAVLDEKQLPALRVLAAVQIGDQAVVWPPAPEPVKRPAIADPPTSQPKPPSQTTVTLTDDDLEVVSLRAVQSPAAAPEQDSAPGRLTAFESPAEAALRSPPMILGSFRLAVFSPDYESRPDDPLLSTLVIRDKPSFVVDGEEPAPLSIEDSLTPPLSTTHVLANRSETPPLVLGLAGTIVMTAEGSESRSAVLPPPAGKGIPPAGVGGSTESERQSREPGK